MANVQQNSHRSIVFKILRGLYAETSRPRKVTGNKWNRRDGSKRGWREIEIGKSNGGKGRGGGKEERKRKKGVSKVN